MEFGHTTRLAYYIVGKYAISDAPPYLYTLCTFRLKTLQDVFIHLERCYTLHERSFSIIIINKGLIIIHNGGISSSHKLIFPKKFDQTAQTVNRYYKFIIVNCKRTFLDNFVFQTHSKKKCCNLNHKRKYN